MPQRPIQYADPAFDRVAERRTDEAWLTARLADTGSRFTFICNRKHVVVDDNTRWWTAEIAQVVAGGAAHVQSHAVLLGEVEGTAHFAIEVAEQHLDAAPLGNERRLAGLRELVGEVDSVEATALAYAGALAHWHRGHQFCPACGAPTVSTQAGHVRRCTDERCTRAQFPRTDPAVICLVIDGERALLARRTIWPAHRRSTLAGFVEPSETLEQAVQREVFEEVGVRVGRVVYRGSQPWPFPASLMLGFWAYAESVDIQVDNDEIAEASWFTRAQMRDGVRAGTLTLPQSDSISRRLVDDWLALAGQ